MRAGGETGAAEGEVPPPPPPPPQAATSIAVHMANENFTRLVFMATPPPDHSAPVRRPASSFTWERIGSRFDAAREAQFHTADQLTQLHSSAVNCGRYATARRARVSRDACARSGRMAVRRLRVGPVRHAAEGQPLRNSEILERPGHSIDDRGASAHFVRFSQEN